MSELREKILKVIEESRCSGCYGYPETKKEVLADSILALIDAGRIPAKEEKIGGEPIKLGGVEVDPEVAKTRHSATRPYKVFMSSCCNADIVQGLSVQAGCIKCGKPCDIKPIKKEIDPLNINDISFKGLSDKIGELISVVNDIRRWK